MQKKINLMRSKPEGTKEKPPLTDMIKSGSTAQKSPQESLRSTGIYEREFAILPKAKHCRGLSLSTLLTRQ